jgi:hypothetical protein
MGEQFIPSLKKTLFFLVPKVNSNVHKLAFLKILGEETLNFKYLQD